jgi:hypothetical protein
VAAEPITQSAAVARNIEIKARIENADAVRSKVARLADRGPVELVQDDWFFSCPAGRLKLRVFSAEQGELIFYHRADHPGPGIFVLHCADDGAGFVA